MTSAAVSQPSSSSARWLGAAGGGAAVALALGVYGNVHDPSQKLVFTLFFSSTIALKVWLATLAVFLGLVQVALAVCLYGRLPWQAPHWAGGAHRISGRLAFLTTL